MRYVDVGGNDFVVPESIQHSEWWVEGAYLANVASSKKIYQKLVDHGIPKEDARFVLPLATTTKLIMTANFRQLRHVIELRCAKGAQWEIRELAMEILHRLDIEAPTVFYDLTQKFYNRKGEND
jgi:thymidylate synthase (FAD)